MKLSQLHCYLVLGALTVALLSACGGGGSEQRCNPKTNSGCPTGQACSVDGTGTAVCTTAGGQLSEGSLCQPAVLDESLSGIDLSQRCAAGLGCISYQGVSRCLRFCDPDGSASQCSQVSDHPLGAFARCGIILDDRPDIGLCSLPCHLSQPDASTCPEGSQCSLLTGASVAHCGQVGTQPLNAGCGPACQCGPGLVCVRDAFGQSCRTATNPESGCGEDAFVTPLPGTQDPTVMTDTSQSGPYLACTPCRVIRGDGLSLCANATGCRDDGGLLASVSAEAAASLRAAVALHEEQGGVLVGAQMNDDGQWIWEGSGQPVDTALWAATEVPVPSQCVVLNGAGRLEVSDVCAGPALCLRTIRQPCAP